MKRRGGARGLRPEVFVQREGGREKGREGGRKGGREGMEGKVGQREGDSIAHPSRREGGREGGREGLGGGADSTVSVRRRASRAAWADWARQ